MVFAGQIENRWPCFAVLILFSLAVTVGLAGTISIGNAFSGLGDGATVRHTAPIFFPIPIGALFVCLAISAILRGQAVFWTVLIFGFTVLIAGMLTLSQVRNAIVDSTFWSALALPIVYRLIRGRHRGMRWTPEI